MPLSRYVSIADFEHGPTGTEFRLISWEIGDFNPYKKNIE